MQVYSNYDRVIGWFGREGIDHPSISGIAVIYFSEEFSYDVDDPIDFGFGTRQMPTDIHWII